MNDYFTRNDHLSNVSLERYFDGELSEPSILEHLEGCAQCAARLDAIQAHADAFKSEPPRLPKRSAMPVYAPLLAAAAALIIYLNVDGDPAGHIPAKPGSTWVEPQDYFRVKGSLNVEFFVKRDQVVERAKEGAQVYPGDRLGFRVSTPTAGHLMIAGIDGKDEPYLCYPQNNKGHSNPFGPTKEMTTLDQAVVLDGVLGQEDLVAVFCASPFHFDTIAKALKGARSKDERALIVQSQGCRERTIRLSKQSPETK